MIKNIFSVFLCVLLCGVLTNAAAQEKDTASRFTQEQLMEPAQLSGKINQNDTNILILNIGFVNDIKNAVHIGAASDSGGLDNLSKYLKDVPKDKKIIIYCGCCPLDICPNVGKAYTLLKKEGFTDFKVLDLKDNLSKDWIDKGYPMAKNNKEKQ